MINFIKTNRNILGSLILAVAGIAAGCATKAETVKPNEPPAQKKETAAAATQTPGAKSFQDPYSGREFDGDSEYSTTAPQRSAADLTKTSFGKIKIGMTLEEVEKLLGEKGMLVSTMDVNGRKTQIYKWSSDNFTSYIDVTIENGRVAEKKDKGLK